MNTTGVGHGHWLWKTSEALRAGLHAFLSLFLFSPINVALSGMSVAALAFLLYDLPLHPVLLSSAFLVTFSIYTLNLATDRHEDALNFPERARYFVSEPRLLLAIAAACYLAALAMGGTVALGTLPVLCIPLGVGLLYSLRIGGTRLKDRFIGKNATVSLSWALEAALLPAVFAFRAPAVLLMFSLIFVKGLINTMLFDLRDVQGDRSAGVRTVPVVLGVAHTRRLLLALNTSLLVWLFFALQQPSFRLFAPVFVFCLVFGYAYILYLARERPAPKMHYGLLLDGEWMLLLVLCLLSLWLL